ncbi:hypothetical protein [Chlamydia sp.]|uniref:hypothetical protein n=1 Tax=Chlamydia sp. TaxID=35827 RepID=UPI0025BD5C3B|nr:hypothetical protein [Chlamydia sp.]MBQ8498619.1 hypothetical protein [Chlamydia sp.]
MHSPLPTPEVSLETTETSLKEKNFSPTVVSGQIVIYPEDPFANPSTDPCFVS